MEGLHLLKYLLQKKTILRVKKNLKDAYIIIIYYY